MPPRCTVLVPSYNRIPSLLELLEALREQVAQGFEVLVIEQSTRCTRADRQALTRLVNRDPRFRLHQAPPLGVGGARNLGLRLAHGEIVLIIDDDDLPAGADWIRQHLKNYEDPRCIAVHGSERRADGRGGELERAWPWLAHRWAMSYSLFGTPRAFPASQRRKEGVAYLRGGNSSVRRAWALRAGGWLDECGNGQEEHDFSFRLRALFEPMMMIVFDPTARMIRRVDIAGGAERRTGSVAREIEGNIRFYLRVIGRHTPWRLWLLAPLYPLVVLLRSVAWQLDDRRHDPWPAKLRGLLELTLAFPFYAARALWRVRLPLPPSKGTVDRGENRVAGVAP